MVVLKNTIDKSSPLPIYYQIRENIKDLIAKGELKSGDKVPTEEEFCKAFSVSRMTVRQALEDNKSTVVATFTKLLAAYAGASESDAAENAENLYNRAVNKGSHPVHAVDALEAIFPALMSK